MTISAVIPTKNRPADLLTAVRSLLAQSTRPDQIVIIDQSGHTASREVITCEVARAGVALAYVHDPSIPGLVAAKAASLARAAGELICFFEDDVVLEPDYLREMKQGFVDRPRMMGCSGVISNPPTDSPVYRFVYRIFHRGVFADPRPDVYSAVKRGARDFAESNIINGGLSGWRREVFQTIRLDTANGFHMMEDGEFSIRVSTHFEHSLFINPKARLAHYPSPLNRDDLLNRQHRKVLEYVLFYKKNKAARFSGPLFIWLMQGVLIECLWQCARLRSFVPLRGYLLGAQEGVRRTIVHTEGPAC